MVASPLQRPTIFHAEFTLRRCNLFGPLAHIADSLSQPIRHCCIQYNRIQQLYFGCVATILDVLAALSRLYHELRVWYDVPKATESTIWAYAGPLAGYHTILGSLLY